MCDELTLLILLPPPPKHLRLQVHTTMPGQLLPFKIGKIHLKFTFRACLEILYLVITNEKKSDLFVFMSVMPTHMCLCTTYVLGTSGGQKNASDSLKLELATESSLQPLFCIFKLLIQLVSCSALQIRLNSTVFYKPFVVNRDNAWPYQIQRLLFLFHSLHVCLQPCSFFFFF